jgi:hypothetical protein
MRKFLVLLATISLVTGITAAAGKLPGVSGSGVQLLAKKRGQVIKSYLVKLGVSKASVTTKVKITRFGSVPKTNIVGSAAAPAPAVAVPVVAAPAAVLTCANGGTCVVGNTGPGGGLVYYVDTAGFSCGASYSATGSPTGGLCKYLEVAPSGWNNGCIPANDPTKKWATGTYSSGNAIINIIGITDDVSVYLNVLGIGLGYKNSDLIKTQNGVYDATTNNYAAGAARAYTGGSKGDWYLPTTAELNLLCQWGRNVTQVVGTACTGGTLNTGTGVSGGFVNSVYSYYRSSSEANANNARNQNFDDGVTTFSSKDDGWYVRPVRAF